MRTAAVLLALCLFVPSCSRPDDPPAKPASAWAQVEDLVRRKEYDQAAQLLEGLRAQRGDDPELILRLAEVRRLQDDPARAILLLRDTLAAKPDARILHAPLAQIYVLVGDFAHAREVLEQGRAAGADEREIALLLGTCLGRMGESEAALAEFERGRAAGADEKLVLYNRALVLGQVKRNAEAIAALEEVVRRWPQWPAGRRELARALVEGTPADRKAVERALDLLVAVRNDLPEDWRVQETIGDCWLLLGDYDASLQAYTEALRLGQNPKSVEERYRVAALKQRAAAGDPGGAGK